MKGFHWSWAKAKLNGIIKSPCFRKYKTKVIKNHGDAKCLDFHKNGRRPDVSDVLLCSLAAESIKRHAQGDEMTRKEAKDFLSPHVSKTLRKRKMDDVVQRLKKRHRITYTTTDVSTVAQTREDHDLRNAVTHAAGHLAIVTLDDDKRVEPFLRFNMDMTGVGVNLHGKYSFRTLTPMDSQAPHKRVSRGTKLKTNMKLVKASVCAVVHSC